MQELTEMYPDDVFEGSEGNPPTACAVCGGKPVVKMMTNAITTRPNYGLCEGHNGAFAITSKTTDGARQTYIVFSPQQLEEISK